MVHGHDESDETAREPYLGYGRTSPIDRALMRGGTPLLVIVALLQGLQWETARDLQPQIIANSQTLIRVEEIAKRGSAATEKLATTMEAFRMDAIVKFSQLDAFKERLDAISERLAALERK